MAVNPLPEKARQDGDPLAVLFLVLLAALPYLNTLTNAFVYDDRQQVLENPYIHSFRYLGRIFGSTVWTFEGAQGATNYYRPLMTFAYLLAYKAFGLIPFGFHLMNLALHIAVVLLVFAVAERLFRDRLLSLIAAGLFALHPIHTESVAWIAGITDLELSVFFLLTFLLYLRLSKTESESTAAPSWLSYIPILIAYLFCLLSKEQALVLPALLIVYEHFYREGAEEISLPRKVPPLPAAVSGRGRLPRLPAFRFRRLRSGHLASRDALEQRPAQRRCSDWRLSLEAALARSPHGLLRLP